MKDESQKVIEECVYEIKGLIDLLRKDIQSYVKQIAWLLFGILFILVISAIT